LSKTAPHFLRPLFFSTTIRAFIRHLGSYKQTTSKQTPCSLSASELLPIERSLLVGEVSGNFYSWRAPRGQRYGSLTAVFSTF
jgi:hypothetical protein